MKAAGIYPPAPQGSRAAARPGPRPRPARPLPPPPPPHNQHRAAPAGPAAHSPSAPPCTALRPVLRKGRRLGPEAAGGKETPGRTNRRPRPPPFPRLRGRRQRPGRPAEPKMAAGAEARGKAGGSGFSSRAELLPGGRCRRPSPAGSARVCGAQDGGGDVPGALPG